MNFGLFSIPALQNAKSERGFVHISKNNISECWKKDFQKKVDVIFTSGSDSSSGNCCQGQASLLR
jgi:hypothetical protein